MKTFLLTLFCLMSGMCHAQNHAADTDTLKPVMLDELQVKAERVIHKDDHQIMYMSKQNESFGTNALDGISSLPLFETSINGMDLISWDKQKVYILINGIPSTAIDLRSYKGADIKRIEYYPNPPAEYINVASGPVVNVIVKRRHDRQYSGYINSSNAVNTGFGTNQANLNYADSLNQIKLNYLIDYRDIRRINTETRYDFLPSSHAVFNGVRHYEGQYQNISASYQRYQRNSLFNVKLTGIFDPGEERDTRSQYVSSEGTGIHGNGEHYLKSRTNSMALDMYYSYRFKKKQMLILNLVNTFGLSYSRDNETMASEETSSDDYNYDLLSGVDNRSYSLVAHAVYKMPLWKGQFQISSRYGYSRLSQTYSESRHIPYSHNEFVNAGGSWHWKHGSIVPVAGLSIIKQKSVSTSYSSALPYMRLYADWWPEGKLQGASMQLTMTFKNVAPTLANLTDSRTYLTPWFVSMGNPELKNYWNGSARLVMFYVMPNSDNMAFLIVNPSYSHNKIANTIVKEKQDNVYFLQPQDIGGEFDCTMYLTVKYHPFKWLELSPYFEYYISHFDTPSENIRFHYIRFGGTTTVDFSKLSFVLAWNSATREYDGDLLSRGSVQWTAQCLYKTGNWSLGAQYNYLAQNSYTTANIKGFSYHDRTDWKPLKNLVRITATYTFSVGRSRRQGSRQINDTGTSDSGLGKFNTAKAPE